MKRFFKGYPQCKFNPVPCKKAGKLLQADFVPKELIIKLRVVLRNCSLFFRRYLQFQTSECQNVSMEVSAKFHEKFPAILEPLSSVKN